VSTVTQRKNRMMREGQRAEQHTTDKPYLATIGATVHGHYGKSFTKEIG
jgi:hypothetical protein